MLISRWRGLAGQGGNFSPFMFGLVMGMSIFSALSLQWAKQEIARYQALQTARAKAGAEDIAKGMNFAILAENGSTYSEDYSLKRAKAFANSTGQTVGQQEYQVVEREDPNARSFGATRRVLSITAGDDTLLRSQQNLTQSAEEIQRTAASGTQPVAMYSTDLARDRQVRTSRKNMESLAEQIFAFYGGKLRFPNPDEFTTLSGKFAVKDVWNQNFDYVPAADLQSAVLSFTTPWNYTQSINLNLKDEPVAPE